MMPETVISIDPAPSKKSTVCDGIAFYEETAVCLRKKTLDPQRGGSRHARLLGRAADGSAGSGSARRQEERLLATLH